MVFSINNQSIGISEFQQQMDKEKLMVIHDYQSKYQATYSPQFWTTSFGGELPVNTLKQRTKEAIISITIKKMIAREMGLIENIGYEDFLKELDKVNKQRAKAVKEGEIIYGPVTYQQEVYSGYYLSTLENAIKEKMSKTDTTPEETKSRYDAMVQERIKTAKINIYNKVYEQIKVH